VSGPFCRQVSSTAYLIRSTFRARVSSRSLLVVATVSKSYAPITRIVPPSALMVAAAMSGDSIATY
jgi:hypothetical protein